MKFKIKQILTVLLIPILFLSCNKDNKDQVAPEIPPLETMVIDFGNLGNFDKSALIKENENVLSNVNWLYSVTTVSVWNTLVGITLAVPVASFRAAFNQVPARTGDGTWQWSYSVGGFASQYSARLVGQVLTGQVKWEMYITKTGIDPFDEFLWFEGTSELDGASGQWTLYLSPQYPVKVIQIDWQKEADQIGNIKYTYLRETDNSQQPDPFYGSYLNYGLQDSTFDAYINIHAFNAQVEGFTNTDIQWSRTDFSGRVKSENFYGDTAWHCWDTNGNDANCPQ